MNTTPLVVSRTRLPRLFTIKRLAIGWAYGYLCGSCPTDDSFDAQNELMQVFRGDHLPEGDPGRPPAEGIGRYWKTRQANQKTQMVMGVHHEVHLQSLAYAATLVTIRCLDVNQEYKWIGVNGKWKYRGFVDYHQVDAEMKRIIRDVEMDRLKRDKESQLKKERDMGKR